MDNAHLFMQNTNTVQGLSVGSRSLAGNRLTWMSRRIVVPTLIVILLGLVPLFAELTAQPFYITLVSRILIFALAAVGLSLVLGYGGMASMGHALYIGIGAYSVGILSSYGITDGWIHLGAALGVGLVTAIVIGFICLRTSGVGYIMITLAFGQMFYFLAVSLKKFGGDDGLSISARSNFHLFDIGSDVVLYYTIFVVLFGTVFLFHKLVNARFGMVLRGCTQNIRRMGALGYPVLRYRLSAYVISCLTCVVAGILLANLTLFVSPSYMQWSMSGDLVVMAVLGGLGSLMGPVVGALVWLGLEAMLSAFPFVLPWGLETQISAHWLGLMGVIVIVVTITLKQGLYRFVVSRKEPAK